MNNKRIIFFVVFCLIFFIDYLFPKNKAKKWITPEEVKSIELLISTPSGKSIASMAGHLNLLIRKKNDIKGLSTVIGFVANTSKDEGKQINLCLYSLRGLTGYYKSLVLEEDLSTLVLRNTIIENRNIYRLKLNLSREQINELLNKITVLKEEIKKKRYYFLNRNCTSFMLNLINSVLNKKNRISDNNFIDLPLNVGRKTYEEDLAYFSYPEYLSISNLYRFSYKRNQTIIKAFKELLTTKFKDKDRFLHLMNILNNKKNTNKKIFLDELIKIYEIWIKDKQEINENLIQNFGELLLEYLINLKEIERYINYKNIKNKGKIKELPDLNSKNVIFLIEKILILRSNLVNKFGLNMSNFEVNIKENFIKKRINKRKKSSIVPSYSIFNLIPYYKLDKSGRNKPGIFFKYSLIRQKMGDHSVFALNHNTDSKIMEVEYNLFDNKFKNTAFTLLSFDKIVKEDCLKANNFFNYGFGIKLLEIEKQKNYLLKSYKELIKFKLLLNIFQKDDFLNFSNIIIGTGYTNQTSNENRNFNCMNFEISFKNKIHLGGNYQNILRINSGISKDIDFNTFDFLRTYANIEFSFAPWRKSGFIFYSGVKYESNFINYDDFSFSDKNNIYFYTGIKFDKDKIFGLFN